MSEIIRNYQKALKLNNKQLQLEILENFGIKAIISRNNNRMYIGVSHYESCFTLMRKLRWDFDYCVHKKGEIYVIDISHLEVENFEENRRLNRSIETVFNFPTLDKKISDIYKLAHKKNYDDFSKYIKEFNFLNYQI